MKPRTWFAAMALTACACGVAGAQQATPAPTVPGGTVVESGTIRNPRPRVYMGLGWSQHNTEAPVITKVEAGSPAARAGLAVGDIMRAVDGRETTEGGSFFPGNAPGRRYTIHVQRGDEELDLVIVSDPPRPAPQP